MARRVLLHVGAMKSGTSFIQSTLGANVDALKEQGVLFPGRKWRDQVLGVVDVLEQTRDGVKPAKSVGAWQRLLDEIEAWSGTAVISMEFLGPTPPEDIARVVETLRPAQVDAVLTVRDLARNIPAMWQEEIQNGATWTWSDFLQAVQKGDPSKPGASRKFWRQQRTHVIARRWADVVGKEHFTVVTVPPAGSPSHILLDRFSSVLGVDPSGFAPPLRRNQSIGVASALVLRALNERLENDPLPNAKYQKFVKTRLAKNGLAGRASQEPSAGLDASWVRKRSEQAISRLRELDVAVVGDLAELRPAKVPGVDPSTVGEGEQLDAALDGLVHLISMWSRS